MVAHIFTKHPQNTCLINTHILIYQYARLKSKLWKVSLFYCILIFDSTTKKAKSMSYPAKPTFGYNYLTKSPTDLGVIFFHRFRDWKDFLCVCMCMCVCMCLCVSVCVYPLYRSQFPFDYHQIWYTSC